MPVGDLAPEIAVLLTAVAALLLAMFVPQRHQRAGAVVALVGLAVATVFALGQLDAQRLAFDGTFALDGATGWARLLILGATAVVVCLCPRWFATDRRHGEFYAMLLFSAAGAMAIAGAADLMQLMMGVLLSSITGYTLAAYHRSWPISAEAGMKYFLVGALANALMVLGIVLVMGMSGTTDYAALSEIRLADPLILGGVMLVLTGLLFKLGAVPAHTWVPDVTEGAPAPAAAFLTVVPKIAASVALVRLVALFPEAESLHLLVGVLSAATMTLGNLAAFWQEDVRRLIGWSSVAQAGYALMAVAVAGVVPEAPAALLAFVAAYAAANLAALAAVAHLRGRTALSDYRGLIQVRPAAATALILAFLSLVGIPPLAGFFGKFTLFLAALDGGFGWLAVIGIANSVLSLFFYLRVIAPMVFRAPQGEPQVLDRLSGFAMGASAAGLLLAVPFLGVLWSMLPRALLP